MYFYVKEVITEFLSLITYTRNGKHKQMDL